MALFGEYMRVVCLQCGHTQTTYTYEGDNPRCVNCDEHLGESVKQMDVSTDGLLARIDRVVAQAITGGWRYYAVYTDGTRDVLRKKATRLYRYAYAHNGAVTSGSRGLAARFTYSTALKASPRYRGGLKQVRVFSVADVSAPGVEEQ